MAKLSFKYGLISIIGLAFLFVATYFSLFTVKEAPNVYVVFRYDDYSNESSVIIENELIKSIAENGFSCSFGIIPFQREVLDSVNYTVTPLDTSKIELLDRYVLNGSIEICQHGYTHSAINEDDHKTEFSGLPKEMQNNKISTAKKYLESTFDTRVNTFIPPWNSYDRSTLEVLEDQGFKNISSDNNGISSKFMGVNYIPSSMILSDLDNILEYNSLPYFQNEAVLILMIHDYDFKEVDSVHGITNIAEYQIAVNRIIKRKWKIISIENAVKQINIFDTSHYTLNKQKQILISHLSPLSKVPYFFKKLSILNSFYLQKGQVIKLLLLVIIYYFGILLVINWIVLLIFGNIQMSSGMSRIFQISILSLLILFGILFWRDHSLGRHEMTILFIIIGFLPWIFRKHSVNNQGI